MEITMQRRVITIKQAAESYFKGVISVSKLYQMVRENKIPHLKISSKKIYFDVVRLERWIQEMDSWNVEEDITGFGELRALRP